MIGYFVLAGILILLIFTPLYYFKLFPGLNKRIDSLKDWMFPSDPHDLNSNSLTLISIGSMVGMGIGFTISAISSGSYLFGLLFIILGLHSLKTHWHLVIN